MKEDLGIEGNEYTYMQSKHFRSLRLPMTDNPVCYTISFAIMQIPSNMIALKIRPRICIVICEIGWTIFT